VGFLGLGPTPKSPIPNPQSPSNKYKSRLYYIILLSPIQLYNEKY
jgi:hypothetical protein